MEVISIKKEANLIDDSVTITVEIQADRVEGYIGFDVFPDGLIPALLIAMGEKLDLKKAKSVELL